MITIEDYILKPLAERQFHLRLGEPCIERGVAAGKGTSTFCKGLLAHIHDTTIPTGMKVHVCHACNNQICSNPNHLYWGTARENRLDQKVVGSLSIWERTVQKHGLEQALINLKKSSSKGGKANRGKSKTAEHIENMRNAIR